uniref:tRNA_SAD domain-containing protein n=1 Tax=Steinernema glaseri TaxID=37863 RepID=A0A1I7YUQ5_9BILA
MMNYDRNDLQGRYLKASNSKQPCSGTHVALDGTLESCPLQVVVLAEGVNVTEKIIRTDTEKTESFLVF